MSVFISVAALIIAFFGLWVSNRAVTSVEETIRKTALKETTALREKMRAQENLLANVESRVIALEAALESLQNDVDTASTISSAGAPVARVAVSTNTGAGAKKNFVPNDCD